MRKKFIYNLLPILFILSSLSVGVGVYNWVEAGKQAQKSEDLRVLMAQLLDISVDHSNIIMALRETRSSC